jgi:type II secretory ATPase GspE/PulE/Tfp pilus assembly ATPase PilB-like protein
VKHPFLHLTKKDKNTMLEEAKITQLLVGENYVSKEDLAKAEQYAQAHHTAALDYLVDQGLLSRTLLGQAIAESFGMVFADIQATPPSREQVLKLPEDLAKQYRLVLFKDDGKTIVVATDTPTKEALAALSPLAQGRKVKLAYALPEYIDASLADYRKQLQTRFGEIIKAGGKIAPEIIDQILQDALTLRASDIHFEPQEKEVVIRFRVDGVLHEAGILPKEYYENMVNRIKVQAHLRIDEHQAAQDGAIRFASGDFAADLRVSILPTLDGEKVVIRLLAAYVKNMAFAGLGLSNADQISLMLSAKKPFGMILVTGPTGSGKTTTLYSLVKELQGPERNITTIEDPVEYRVAGINQIQVNNQTNLTFAKGLRSIARQDPDIILVGEIRDLETAEIAVNAALTGHLLLSTFHANDAVSSVPRLLDMGIEPFLLASTLDLIIAQRLCRKICESCRVSQVMTPTDIQKVSPVAAKYFGSKSATLYIGKGCPVCNNTGYKGRMGVYELLKITPEIQDVVISNPASKKIFDLARQQGFHSMWEDGLEKVKAGIISLEELARVVSPS